MYCLAFVVPPHHYSSSMLGGALPSGKRSYGTPLWKLEVFQNSFFLSTPLHPPHLPPFFYSISFTLSRCVPATPPHPPSSLGLILGEHLTDVLLKDEKRSGGESKSKQRSMKNKIYMAGWERHCWAHTHIHTLTPAHVQKPRGLSPARHWTLQGRQHLLIPYLIAYKGTLRPQKTSHCFFEEGVGSEHTSNTELHRSAGQVVTPVHICVWNLVWAGIFLFVFYKHKASACLTAASTVSRSHRIT